MTILEEMQRQDFELLEQAKCFVKQGERYFAASKVAGEVGNEELQWHLLLKAERYANLAEDIHKELMERVKAREDLLKILGA